MIMKTKYRLNGLPGKMAIVIILASIRIASGQTVSERISPIPENINKIFRTSCYSCHGSNGKALPMIKLNFSRWTEYGAAKEAEMASTICSVVTQELMPPKSIRKSKPELIPSKEQTELICSWAESLKPKEQAK